MPEYLNGGGLVHGLEESGVRESLLQEYPIRLALHAQPFSSQL